MRDIVFLMSLETLITEIQQKLSLVPPLGAKYKFDFGDDGVVYMDGTQSPPVITQDDIGEVNTTFESKLEVFQGIVNGTQDPTMAFMMGKMKVKGSMGYAMKLNSLLED